MRLLRLAPVLAIVVGSVTTGCTSTRPVSTGPASTPPPSMVSVGSQPTRPPLVVRQSIPSSPRRTRNIPVAGETQRLVESARQLLHTPYRYGGESLSGFDCSGFTRHVFRGLGVELPRVAKDQARTGRWIPLDELRTGDLVFFGEIRQAPFHVGLVISALGEPLTMIHASKSSGVVETRVTASDYWLGRLEFGRRIVP